MKRTESESTSSFGKAQSHKFTDKERLAPQNITNPTIEDVRRLNLSIPEIVKNIREFKKQLDSLLTQEDHDETQLLMLEGAIKWNREALKLLAPKTLGDFYEQFNIKFNFPRFPFPELRNELIAMLKKLKINFPSPGGISNLETLGLDLPRNILNFEIAKRIKMFSITDISPSFIEYLRNTGNTILFLTHPIYEKYTDSETLVPSENTTEKIVRLGGADFFPENRSLTLVSKKKLKQIGTKMYIPLGIVYSNDVEKDDFLTLTPTKIEIVGKDGKVTTPSTLNIVSNGQLYVEHDPKILYKEVRVIYGKPSADKIREYLSFGESQSDHRGLAELKESEAPFSSEEEIFRRFLLNNKSKEEGSNNSQEESLNKILKYMKDYYLRYSLLDTIRTKDKVDNARRALRNRRTSCLGAATVAKSFVDTYKFTPQFKTSSGILSGFRFNYKKPEKSEKINITAFDAHAVTLASLGEKTRVYDISPGIQYQEPMIEEKIRLFNHNTNRVYRVVKELFLDSGRDLFPKYRSKYSEALELLKTFNTNYSALDKENYAQYIVGMSMNVFLKISFTDYFGFSINTQGFSNYERFSFPFKLISRLEELLEDIQSSNFSQSARNNPQNRILLAGYGLDLGKQNFKLGFLPVSRFALDLLRSVKELKERNPNLMQTLVDYVENIFKLRSLGDYKRDVRLSANKLLMDKLKQGSIEVDSDSFNEISWLECLWKGDQNNLLQLWGEDFSNRLEEVNNPDRIIELGNSELASFKEKFESFLTNKSEEILKIFKDTLLSQEPPKEKTFSSTYLFSGLVSKSNEFKRLEKKVAIYKEIREKLGNLFFEYYKSSDDPTLLSLL